MEQLKNNTKMEKWKNGNGLTTKKDYALKYCASVGKALREQQAYSQKPATIQFAISL